MRRELQVGLLALMLCVGALLSGCHNRAQQGAAIGVGAGALAGAIIGHQSGNRSEGALLGMALGGLAGYITGNEWDKSDAEYRMDAIEDEQYHQRQESRHRDRRR